MDIGIFGQHPDNKVGFNSAMSMSWIMSLNKLGYKVTLYLDKLGLNKNVSDLERWGVDFNIVLLDRGDDFSASHDVIIWQTYEKKDHENFWHSFRRASAIKVKNFPRFFTKNIDKDRVRLKNSLAAFDIILFSLKEDLEIANFLMPNSSRFSYVPRGFNAKELSPNFKSNHFLVSVDVRKSTKTVAEDYEVFLKARKLLGSKGNDIKYQVLGAEIPGFERVKRGSALDFYNNFINPCHVYSFVDRNVNFTDMHSTPGGKETYCGVYENTIVEARISGSMVIGPDKFIANELLKDGYSGLRLNDDRCHINLADSILYAFENHKVLSQNIRNDAIRSNSLVAMANGFSLAVGNITNK
jgi:hypothetical protein